jgi:hypothetical protein
MIPPGPTIILDGGILLVRWEEQVLDDVLPGSRGTEPRRATSLLLSTDRWTKGIPLQEWQAGSTFFRRFKNGSTVAHSRGGGAIS